MLAAFLRPRYYVAHHTHKGDFLSSASQTGTCVPCTRPTTGRVVHRIEHSFCSIHNVGQRHQPRSAMKQAPQEYQTSMQSAGKSRSQIPQEL